MIRNYADKMFDATEKFSFQLITGLRMRLKSSSNASAHSPRSACCKTHGEIADEPAAAVGEKNAENYFEQIRDLPV
jgi:hypothetical protein